MKLFPARSRPAATGNNSPLLQMLVPLAADLQLLQGDLLLSCILCHEEAAGLHSVLVVFHVQRDGPAGLGSATDMVELEAL
jgi:hypothetical protein